MFKNNEEGTAREDSTVNNSTVTQKRRYCKRNLEDLQTKQAELNSSRSLTKKVDSPLELADSLTEQNQIQNKNQETAEQQQETAQQTAVVKRKRGRPKKVRPVEGVQKAEPDTESAKKTRKRRVSNKQHFVPSRSNMIGYYELLPHPEELVTDEINGFTEEEILECGEGKVHRVSGTSNTYNREDSQAKHKISEPVIRKMYHRAIRNDNKNKNKITEEQDKLLGEIYSLSEVEQCSTCSKFLPINTVAVCRIKNRMDGDKQVRIKTWHCPECFAREFSEMARQLRIISM